MRKYMLTMGCFALALALCTAVVGAQDEARATRDEVDEESFNEAVESAQEIVDRQAITIPAVIRFGPRRGEPMADGDQAETNATIDVTQSTLEASMGAELFVYGIPVLDDQDDHGSRQLVGRARIVDRAYQDEMPLATIQLDEGALLSGSVNSYYVLNQDLGDALIPDNPQPDDTMRVAQAVAGLFTVSSRITDSSLDGLTRGSFTSTLRAGCKTSVFCTGWLVGPCACYWSKVEKENVCGKKKSIITGRCVGWCPG